VEEGDGGFRGGKEESFARRKKFLGRRHISLAHSKEVSRKSVAAKKEGHPCLEPSGGRETELLRKRFGVGWGGVVCHSLEKLDMNRGGF